MTTPTFCPFLAAGKFTLHSLCLNQELDVCLFLALGYFLIGMGGEARHRGANISLSTSQQRERRTKQEESERAWEKGKRGNFLHSSKLRGRTKSLGKTMGNPLSDGQPECTFLTRKTYIFVLSARNQCKFASRFLFCGWVQLKLRAGVCKAES